MGILAALYDRHVSERDKTLALAKLGTAGAAPLGANFRMLPRPRIKDINSRTKDAHVLCVRLLKGGRDTLIPLLCPMSRWEGRELAHELVSAGVHPLDIVIASVASGLAKHDDAEPEWEFHTAVDCLLWTHRDQAALERAAQRGK